MPIHNAAIIHPFTYRTAALEFLISRGADLTVIDKVIITHTNIVKVYHHTII